MMELPTIFDLFGLSSVSLEALCFIFSLSSQEMETTLHTLIHDFRILRSSSRYRLNPSRSLIDMPIRRNENLWNRSVDYFEKLAKNVEPKLTGKEQNIYLDLLEQEHDIFRWILSYIVSSITERKDRLLLETQLFSIAGSLSRFWWMRGHSKEGWNWIQQIFQVCTEDRDNKEWKIAKARVLKGAGAIQFSLGSLEESLKWYQASKAIWEEVEDELNLAGRSVSASS